MRVRSVSPVLVSVCLLFACLGLAGAQKVDLSKGGYDDLTKNADRNTVATQGKVYRMGETGICGTVEEDHILVTDIIPGSIADGKIQKVDRYSETTNNNHIEQINCIVSGFLLF